MIDHSKIKIGKKKFFKRKNIEKSCKKSIKSTKQDVRIELFKTMCFTCI